MNTMKKNGGFTLVELIIVIAILAILSTGAIAGYSAYITSANNAAVEAVLSDISTSAVLANAQAGPVSSIELAVSDDGKTWTIKINANTWDNDNDGFKYLFNQSMKTTGDFKTENNVTYFEATLTPAAKWNSSDYKNDTISWDGASWDDPTKGN